LNARIKKLDLEGVVRDAAALANELIKPMLVDDAAPVRIGVGAVISAWRRSIHGHAEPDLFSLICGSENEVQIARAKPIGNAAAFEGGFSSPTVQSPPNDH
jgi:hypothetical protein